MTGDMLSQEEIDALLRGSNDEISIAEELNDIEKDALGEIGNISMGTAATTLFTLLGQKVIITTPQVSITDVEELASQYPIPFVAVDVKYRVGLEGANLLILKANDVKVITDLMMGGDGTNTDRDLNEMDLSAISEAMNQMVGSSCTSLSEMFSNKIDIDPPRAFEMKFYENNTELDLFNITEAVVKISFKMVVGNLIDSEIMQIIPLSFAKNMVNKLLGTQDEPLMDFHDDDEDMNNFLEESHHLDDEPLSNISSADGRQRTTDYYHESEDLTPVKQNSVNVKKAEFQSFDNESNASYHENIGLIQEIPIEITVELGRTTRKISEILEYGPGTILELDKLVGEALEVFANGKFIAKGEVVVIDDSFGIRITDIINPSKRISKL